jgi:hypothetical protein
MIQRWAVFVAMAGAAWAQCGVERWSVKTGDRSGFRVGQHVGFDDHNDREHAGADRAGNASGE